MPETCNALSKDEVKALLDFFKKNEYLVLDEGVNPELLSIVLKINFFSSILETGVPKDKHILNDGLHVSLLPNGRQQLQAFLEK